MSTIKSSSEHLVLNADGAGKEVKIQRNGTQVMATTSSGIDVTGAVNSTGEMRITNPSADSRLYLYGASGYKANIILNEYGVRAWHIGAGTFGSGHLSISDGSTEKLRIQSGGGISFNGDTATANALDDYEEGTWTPTAVGLTISSVNYARYIKVGGVVNWFFYINATSGTGSDCVIGGLPYTSNLDYCMQGNINSSNSNPAMTNPHFRLPPNSTNLHALKGNDTVIAGQDLDGSHIIASGTYTAA